MPATGACSRRTSPDARFCRRRAKSHGSAAGLRNEGTFVGKLLAQRPVRVLRSHGEMIRLLRRCGLAVENLRPDPDATASHPLEIKNRDVTPSVRPDAYVAVTAVLSGQVSVGAGSCVGHGAVLTADGGPADLGANCVIMDNAVLRGTPRHPLVLGDHVLAGPDSYLTGCRMMTRCSSPPAPWSSTAPGWAGPAAWRRAARSYRLRRATGDQDPDRLGSGWRSRPAVPAR